jgi:SAM-dependent methyltransferase
LVVNHRIPVPIFFDESQIEIARNQANDSKIKNVSFRSADIYELPFNNDSFDAAFAHTTLQHLSDPVKALREIHRVLKPEGIIGVRDDDVSSSIFAPNNPLIEEGEKIFKKVWRHNGGDPLFGRLHRQSLREAGFVNIESFATCLYCGTPEAIEEHSKFLIAMVSAPNFRNQAIAMNLCDQQMLDDLINELRKWGKHPDAFFAVIFCEAVGWVK